VGLVVFHFLRLGKLIGAGFVNPRAALSLLVREARLSDAPQLAPLCRQLGYPSTVNEVETRLKQIQGQPDHMVFVAQQTDGTLAGFLDVFVMRTVESNARAEVGGLVVDEACRSLGIGRLLMERAEDWARRQGCKEIGLRSNVIRKRAHTFYENIGYKVIKTQKSFRKTL
jgi:GNAT superfamily N-acetyltransferase